MNTVERHWISRAAAAVRPRHAAALVAALCIGLALVYATRAQPPVGRVEGQVIRTGASSPVKGAQVILTPLGDEGKVLYSRTDERGRFLLAHVPVGEYQVAAYLDTYAVEEEYLRVDEARTSTLTLALSFARPELQLVGPRRSFMSAERLVLPVRGYVDSATPAGQRVVVARVFRTRLSTALRDRRTAQALSYGGESLSPSRLAELLKPQTGPAPQLLWQRRFPITEAGAEGFFTKTLDLGAQPVGLYIVEARHAATTVSTWLLVSDTVLVLKRTAGEALAYVVDAASGTPVAGSEVRLFRDGSVIVSGRTAADGLVRFPLPDNVRTTYLVAVARRGDDEAVLGRSDYLRERDGPFVLHAYTERPIYRPGQRIYFKGIARKRAAPESYAVPVGRPVAVEIMDPSGEPLLRQRFQTNAFGSFHGRIDLSPEAPTGIYALVLKAGESTTTHDIIVAAYRKPEFSVTLKPERPRYVRGDRVRVDVAAQFYFGAPVAGSKATYTVYRNPDWMAEYVDLYDESPDPEEGDEYGWYYGDGRPVTQGEVQLDDQGKAAITFPAEFSDTPDVPQDQIFSVQVNVTDSAGREVSAEDQVQVAGGAFRLTVRPQGYFVAPGRPLQVDVVSRDYERRPAPDVPFALEVSYDRWDSERQEYVGRVVATHRARTGPNGQTTLTITLPRKGSVRLRATASDAGGRTVRGGAWLWAWDDAPGDFDMRYTQLSLHPDKRRYRAGDTARVLLNTDRIGQSALITIEGNRIHRAFVVPIASRSTAISIPILPEYGPNVFLAALYVKDKQASQSQLALSVSVPARELTVRIQTDKPAYEPGQRATYTVEVTDAHGKPAQAELSLAVVDESIYALQEDDPRALRNAFYPRRWNAVYTHVSSELWYLGNGDKADSDVAVRRRFVDTAYWQPTLRTDARGRATVSFTLPDNLTTWRATVLAHTLETRLGRSAQKAVVSKPFFVRLETPRLFSQHDRSRIMALVHNETDETRQATVRLFAEGLRTEGAAEQTVSLPPRKMAQIAWPVVADRPGEVKVRVTARAGGTPAHADALEVTVPVRPYGRTLITGQTGDVTAGRSAVESAVIEQGAIPEATRLTVRITPSVTHAVGSGLDYLIGYPYGCVEQTMSRFLPTVMVQQVLAASGLHLRRPGLEAEIPKMVHDGLTRLYQFQSPESGGWGWWWEYQQGDPWMTAYVLYGLATAKAAGYPVRESVLTSGRKAAVELAAAARPDTRMFLLYAVAMAGDPEAARGLRAATRLSDLKSEGLAYAVLLDRLLGRDVRPAFTQLGRRAISEDGTLYWSSTGANQWDWEWSSHMATALGLRAMLAVDPSDPRVERAVRWLMLHRTNYYWANTRDTSWVLAALTEFLRTEGGTGPGAGEVRIRVNGRTVRTFKLAPDRDATRDVLMTLTARELRAGRNEVAVDWLGGPSRIFYTLSLRQTVSMSTIPELAPVQVRVTREYRRVLAQRDPDQSWRFQSEPTRNALRQGDRVLVRLTLTTPRELGYVVIEDPFPAGFEVTERDRSDVSIDDWYWWWDSTDVRDDRVAIFARRIPAGTHVIEYNLRAQTPGEYHSLPTILEGMYNPRLRAESSGVRVVVR